MIDWLIGHWQQDFAPRAAWAITVTARLRENILGRATLATRAWRSDKNLCRYAEALV